MSFEPTPTLLCTQCGGTIEQDSERFCMCPHCASTLYLDKGQVVLHYALVSTLDTEQAERTLRRWMGGNETVKDLDQKARIERTALRHFPLWVMRVGQDGGECTYVEPAAATTLSLLKGLSTPPGDLQPYDPERTPHAIRPSVPLETARKKVIERATSDVQIRETALVHVPLHFFQFSYRNKTYSAAVDGSSGRVLADRYPTRWELPYRAVAATTLLLLAIEIVMVYLMVPWLGDRWVLFFFPRCAFQLVAGVPLFLVAWLVARKA